MAVERKYTIPLEIISKRLNNIADTRQWFMLGAIIMFMLLAFLFMQKVTVIRIRELEFSLRDQNPEKTAGASLSLLARYQMLQKRIAGKLEAKEDFLAESELLAVASGSLLSNADRQDLSLSEKMVISVMNGFGYLTGSEPVKSFKNEKGENILQAAFLYERRRDYEKAITAYSSALAVYAQKPERLSYIYLHRGFCRAMGKDKKAALLDLEYAYRTDPAGENGITAKALSVFISELESQLSRVLTMQDSDDKGELLYRLMTYDKAIETLNSVSKNRLTQKTLFLRGRSYEETGNNTKAIADYKRLIAMNPKTEWAIKANRRLYMLGAFYESDKKLTEESVKNAKENNDSGLIEETDIYKESAAVEKISVIEKKEEVKETIREIEEKKEELKAAPLPPPVMVAPPITNTAPVNIPLPNVRSADEIKKAEAELERIKKEKEVTVALETIKRASTPRKMRKKLMLDKFSMLDKIVMEDENIYYGLITKETDESVELATVLGQMRLPKDEVEHRSRTPTKGTFIDAPIRKKRDRAEKTGLMVSSAERKKLFAESSSRNERKQILRKNFKELDKLILKDGNQFYGIIYDRNNASTKIMTILGPMKIPDTSIVSREKVTSKKILQ